MIKTERVVMLKKRYQFKNTAIVENSREEIDYSLSVVTVVGREDTHSLSRKNERTNKDFFSVSAALAFSLYHISSIIACRGILRLMHLYM